MTDGQVHNQPQIMSYAVENSQNDDNLQIFSFGIGKNCDQDFVRKLAFAGRGSFSIIKDRSPNILKT